MSQENVIRGPASVMRLEKLVVGLVVLVALGGLGGCGGDNADEEMAGIENKLSLALGRATRDEGTFVVCSRPEPEVYDCSAFRLVDHDVVSAYYDVRVDADKRTWTAERNSESDPDALERGRYPDQVRGEF